MQEWPPKELREHARFEQHIPVRLFQGGSRPKTRQETGEAVVQDLSRSGLLLRTPIRMPVGEPLEFSISLPNGGNVRGNASVRWTQPQGNGHVVGLAIVEMGFLHRRRLSNYLKTPQETASNRFADLALEGAVAVVLLLVAQSLFLNEPWIHRAISDVSPASLLAFTPAIGLLLAVRIRF